MAVVDKKHIIEEIRSTAVSNGGVALGWRRFEAQTGIRYYDWFGRYWSKWGDAVREAGFEPNRMSEAYEEELLVKRLVELTKQLQRVPARGDLLMAARNDSSFPSENAFRRLGTKSQRAFHVVSFCETNQGNEDVAALWHPFKSSSKPTSLEGAISDSASVGYVYLLKHGSRREYKIGRTNNRLRREGEIGIQLPEKILPIHYIETDDPSGIEAYWHTRFALKRKEGEWFSLTNEDIKAFKRWKRIY